MGRTGDPENGSACGPSEAPACQPERRPAFAKATAGNLRDNSARRLEGSGAQRRRRASAGGGARLRGSPTKRATSYGEVSP